MNFNFLVDCNFIESRCFGYFRAAPKQTGVSTFSDTPYSPRGLYNTIHLITQPRNSFVIFRGMKKSTVIKARALKHREKLFDSWKQILNANTRWQTRILEARTKFSASNYVRSNDRNRLIAFFPTIIHRR